MSDAYRLRRRAFRLPRTVVPDRYELQIAPDLGSATFTGSEVVYVTVLEQVPVVVLNSRDLEIDIAWVEQDGNRVDATVDFDKAAELAVLRLDGTLKAGKASVHLSFRGEMSDKAAGFHRSTYVDDARSAHKIAFTRMEPVGARATFPCWDEPDLKAVFAVTLLVPDGLFAVSNAAELARIPAGPGRIAIRFADTIRMSTYLVAFVIGPFEATEPIDVDGVTLRIVHIPGRGHLTDYALRVGAFCLRLYADYLELPYPGEKCDLIALPDFAFGAMENFGAITFAEAVLLIDPEGATEAELQRVADVIAHELAHMWFGDLVTMKWWNSLWLNEAFATFMELRAVDALKPELQRWVTFTSDRGAALAIDSLNCTRPIEFPIRSPEQAEGMFDVLTYHKGASVLRMLEQYLGTHRFRAGIRRYLRTHQFSSADTSDLRGAIEQATDEPIGWILDSWIFQRGHPIVSIERTTGGFRLTQRRFRYLDDADDSAWAIPLLVSFDDAAPERILLDSSTAELPHDAASILANADGHGFFRVGYSPDLMAELVARLSALQPVERLIVLQDAWAAVLTGDTAAVAFLELARRFESETHPAVWTALADALAAVAQTLDPHSHEAFSSYVRTLVAPLSERLGWVPTPGESTLIGWTRQLVLELQGGLGNDGETQARATYMVNSGSALEAADPNVAAAAISIAANVGGDADWARYLDRHRRSHSPQESLRYLYALARFRSPQLAERTLALSLTEVRWHEAPIVIRNLLFNGYVQDVAWSFLDRQWDHVLERFPDNLIPDLLGGIVALSRPDQVASVEAFFSRHPAVLVTRTTKQHLERLRVNVAFRQREADRIAAYLP